MRRFGTARELKGYEHDDVPDYRLVQAPLFIDSVSGNNWFKGQQITKSYLPEVVRPTFPSELRLVQPLSEIVKISEKVGSVHLASAASGEILGVWNSDLSDFQQVTALYWKVSPTTLQPDLVIDSSPVVFRLCAARGLGVWNFQRPHVVMEMYRVVDCHL